MKILPYRKSNALGSIGFRSLGLSSPSWVMVLLLSWLSLISCKQSSNEPGGSATAGQVIENPTAYLGKTVTVSGTVEQNYGPRAFSLESGSGAGNLLILGREPFLQKPEAGGDHADHVGDIATVTGVVRKLIITDIEREIGWPVEPRIETEFKAKPILIAQTVSFKPNPTPSATPSPSAGTNGAEPGREGAKQPITELTTLLKAPDKQTLIGRPVQLADVNVQSVVSDRGFWIGDDDNRVFARLDERLNQGSAEWDVVIRPGQTRTLTGEIRELPSLEQIRNWPFIKEADIRALQDRQIYIYVTGLKETRRPLGP